MNFRQWVTIRYAASDWFRLAFILAMLGINLPTMGLIIGVVTFLETNVWFSVFLMFVWMLVLSFFATWLVTWHDPQEY